MKIGDKVRFLNEVGGGKVIAFREKGVVLVEDENGFEIPMLEKELVVIDTNHLNIAVKEKPAPKTPSGVPDRSALLDADDTATEEEITDRPVTFHARPLQRSGADTLNVFLAFVPLNIKELSTTRFEAYLINDSNYQLRFSLLKGSEGLYELIAEDLVEANSKLFLTELSLSELNDWQRLLFQSFAYKERAVFTLKQTEAVALKIDVTKFYKLHTFRPSDFFPAPALLFDIFRDDRPARPMVFNADKVEEEIQQQERPARLLRHATLTEERNGVLEVDLHATELLSTTAGLQPKDILDYQKQTFLRIMDEHKAKRGTKLVFIHGKGNGILRQEIERLLKSKFRTCRFQDASFQEYGYGATMVTIG